MTTLTLKNLITTNEIAFNEIAKEYLKAENNNKETLIYVLSEGNNLIQKLTRSLALLSYLKFTQATRDSKESVTQTMEYMDAVFTDAAKYYKSQINLVAKDDLLHKVLDMNDLPEGDLKTALKSAKNLDDFRAILKDLV
jgi:hypothetical protein